MSDHVADSTACEQTSPGLTAERVAEFVRLLARHHRQLFQYLHVLLPSDHDAEDVLQETCLVLWKKFDQFASGSNFFAWASKVAYYEALAFRGRQTVRRMILDDEALYLVATETAADASALDARHAALADCLNKLRPADRQLIESRYASGVRRHDLATQLGRPANSVSKSLGRIRQTLLRCVTLAVSRLREEGAG